MTEQEVHDIRKGFNYTRTIKKERLNKQLTRSVPFSEIAKHNTLSASQHLGGTIELSVSFSGDFTVFIDSLEEKGILYKGPNLQEALVWYNSKL
jgi:hypothetical protein